MIIHTLRGRARAAALGRWRGMAGGAGGDGERKERKEDDMWVLLAFAGLESPVLESMLVYPLVYEVFYLLASFFSLNLTSIIATLLEILLVC